MTRVTVGFGESAHSHAVSRGKAVTALLAGTVLCAPLRIGPEIPAVRPLPSPSAELRQIVESGHLEGLRWPNFPDVQTSLRALYEESGFTPLWFAEERLSDKAGAVLGALRQAAEKGLDPEDYDASRLAAWASRSSVPVARVDAGISIALMRYAAALHEGRINPRQVRFAIRKKEDLDPARFVRSYLHANQEIGEAFATVEPPFRGYRHTQVSLVHYLQLAAGEDGRTLPRPKLPLKPGQSWSDLPALAARLALLGDLQEPAQGEAFDGAVVEAVRHFQARHGLAPNGILDAPTYAALAVPLSRRIEQLQLTLERWRWLPSSVLPAIAVNIPEFELRAYGEDRQLASRMHVVVGKAYRHRTPVFEDKLQSVIVRPAWNVPLGIQRGEMVPALRADPEYLRKHDLEVLDAKEHPAPALGRAELLSELASGRLRLRQRPGPANSLGLLKFHFPNVYDVYLHGTPARQLFARSRRDFSHGCIRVEDPVSLAEWVLQGQPGWDREHLLAAMDGTETINIPVRRSIAVLVLYGTAVVEENGEVHFFNDIYGYDAELKRVLARGYPYPR